MTFKWIDRIFIMILENHGYSQVQQCKFVDYIKKNGVVFTNWHGVCHPSGPNYRASFSGNHWSFNEFDGIKRPNIADTIPTFQYNFKNAPAERHNPFLDMKSLAAVLNINWAAYSADSHFLESGIHYLGMDDMNDAHSGSLEVADANVMEAIDWWRSIKHDPYRKDLFMITFDEAYGAEYLSNRVFTGMLFPNNLVKSVDSFYSHYNFANFLYENWSVVPPQEMDPQAKTHSGLAPWEIPNSKSIWSKIANWLDFI